MINYPKTRNNMDEIYGKAGTYLSPDVSLLESMPEGLLCLSNELDISDWEENDGIF